MQLNLVRFDRFLAVFWQRSRSKKFQKIANFRAIFKLTSFENEPGCRLICFKRTDWLNFEVFEGHERFLQMQNQKNERSTSQQPEKRKPEHIFLNAVLKNFDL